MSAYREEDYLALSGVQHFCFCPRQWALIHIEQQWAENLLTVEGGILHERAHERDFLERQGELYVTRAMPVSSARLGVSGVLDVLEWRRDEAGIPLRGREGLYRPAPVEYKHGKPKEGDEDRLQLCCQAMCLEEMLGTDVPQGFLFYGETRRRESVELGQALRVRVEEMLRQMHEYYARRYTPRVKPRKACRSCSLKETCLPGLQKRGDADAYIRAHTEEEAP